MFNSRQYYTRMTVAILGSIAVSVMFVRCSPLASSTSKFRNQPEAPIAALGDPLSARLLEPSISTSVSESLEEPSLGQVSLVMPLAAYEDETALLPKSQKLTLSDKVHGDELEAFKESRSLIIQFDGTPPDECSAYFGLSMSEDMIDSFSLNPIQTECTPISENMWLFSIHSAVSDETWDHVAEYLESVTIHVTNDPQMSLAPANRAPVATVGIAPTTPGPR